MSTWHSWELPWAPEAASSCGRGLVQESALHSRNGSTYLCRTGTRPVCHCRPEPFHHGGWVRILVAGRGAVGEKVRRIVFLGSGCTRFTARVVGQANRDGLIGGGHPGGHPAESRRPSAGETAQICPGSPESVHVRNVLRGLPLRAFECLGGVTQAGDTRAGACRYPLVPIPARRTQGPRPSW